MITLIIPCYNKQMTLPILYKELRNVVEKITEETFEFLFVDDGSKDKTLFLLKEYALEDARIKFQEILEKKLPCMRDFAMLTETI